MFIKNLFYFSIFIILYSPSIYGKTYFGVIYLYFLLFIILLTNNIYINKIIKLFIIYTFFILVIDITLLYSSQSNIIAILEIIIYSFIPLISFYIGYYMKQFNREKIFKSIFYVGFIQSLIGILQMLFMNFRKFTFKLFGNFDKYSRLFSERRFGRAIGSVGNPNYYAIFIVIYIVFLINFFHKIKISKYIKILSLIISIYSLVFAQSNTGYLLMVVSLLFMLVLTFSHKFKIKNSILSIVPIINFENFKYFFSRIDIDRIKSIGERVHIWKELYNELIIPYNYHFIIGYGSIFMEKYTTDNYYLKIFLEYGIIGLILFVFLNLILVLKATKIKTFNEKKFVMILMFLILIANIVSEPLLNVKLSPYIYLLYGLFI
ncbi:O-antigen ligase family protein [Selenihalanaerobacter shriftii]|uniref:O-antigen ligase-related domain-containing protein n=1 Tax=Selenihalanaerobacter shriftii TaxID=142842 RepID=A0A1T4QYT2_9FIRM|nr:O-antigen ligase family protein [Selenihalanaerobacter shriftii]SKA08747.1 hypothetical protein SAMN02745118_02749 [Selenihalanaerobacter shriftii]